MRAWAGGGAGGDVAVRERLHALQSLEHCPMFVSFHAAVGGIGLG